MRDLRNAVRSIRQNPGFVLVVSAALALGIGANSAIFSVLNAVMLRPLPLSEPERIVVLSERRQDGVSSEAVRLANLADYKERNRSLENVTVLLPTGFNLLAGTEPERIKGARVSASFFRVLGVEPSMGRDFDAKEDQPGANPVVILSHGLWQRRFGADPSLIGRAISLDSVPHTVVGVMPPRFRFALWGEQDLWAPKVFTSQEWSDRDIFLWYVLGRLRPGLTLEGAQTDLRRISRQLEREHPEQNARWALGLTPLHERMVGPVRPALLLILGAVGFILLVACANVANLLLARNAVRQSEMAVRMVLGASRLRLARQTLAESLVLALLGGAIGLLLALWGTKALVTISPVNLPQVERIGVDWRVLAFTLAVSLLTGLLVGLVPVLTRTRGDLEAALREGGPKTAGSRRLDRLHRAFVVLETALVLALLIGAGLMLKSFQGLKRVELGFESENRLFFEIAVPAAKYPTAREVADFYRRATARIREIPGIQAASGISNAPLSGEWWTTYYFVQGRPVTDSERSYIDIETVTADYFNTLGIPLVKGRLFSDLDDAAAPDVVIINEKMARKVFPDQDAIGQVISVDTPAGPWRTIVGVVADVKHRGLAIESKAQAFVPHAQFVEGFLWHSLQMIVRTASDPLQVVPAIRKAVQEIDPAQSISDVFAYEELTRRSASRPRFLTVLLGLFAALALMLGTVGIYGVVSYSIEQRAQEIGVRMALGAGRRDVLRLTLRRGLAPVLLGVVLGIGMALALARVLSTFLFAVSATDLATYMGVSALLVAIALLATCIPALRAARVRPVDVLRSG